MKKILLLSITLILLLTSCRITKTVTMWNARDNAKLTEDQFISAKKDAISFLNLSEEQLNNCITIWKKEKRGLLEIDTNINEQIAPVIYNSEVEFRKVLTNQQLIDYKAIGEKDTRVVSYFLTDKQLSEIKRIYIDK